MGICGSIARPDEGHDIRLGDIAEPALWDLGRRCQYELIKAKTDDQSERTGFIGRPRMVLLNSLLGIQAAHERSLFWFPGSPLLQEMLEKNSKMNE